jgi:L-malate glycosyltransferase
MRIAFFSTMTGALWGGSEELWFQAARRAIQAGDKVFISIPSERAAAPQLNELQVLGGVIHFWGGEGDWTTRSVEEFKPDIICVSQGGTYDGVEMFYAIDLNAFCANHRTPYVLISQANFETDPWLEVRQMEVSVFSRAARILFVANNNLLTAERHLACSLGNAQLIRNPINLENQSPVPWPTTETIRFACVGRLTVMHKGQDVLFEALASMSLTERDWRLSLYGEGFDLPYLKELAAHYKIQSNVEFRGYEKDVRAIWAKNEILILASRQEGTPLTLVEAMLCGRPAIVTDIGDNAEWIEDGVTGFIAEAPTARSIGRALTRAMSCRDRWPEMGNRGHEFAMTAIDPNPPATLLNILSEVSTGAKGLGASDSFKEREMGGAVSMKSKAREPEFTTPNGSGVFEDILKKGAVRK